MDLWLLAPEISLGFFALLVVVLDLLVERKGILVGVSLAGIVVAGLLTIALWGEPRAAFNNMLAVDPFALFFKLLFLAIAALVLLASVDYVSKFARFQGEFYALVLFSTIGMMLMAATTELISIYIALELTGISLYVLAGFLKDPKSSEAGLKYLLLGGIASAVLLYGMALLFGLTGDTQLSNIAQALKGDNISRVLDSPALLAGMVLVVAGFGFKIASVPFQMWVPDVYEGAPTPVTAYLSVASKAAGFAVILRVFTTTFGTMGLDWGMLFAILSVISMTLGNTVAISQTNIKRMLGYSSIAQAGYLMVGLAAVGFAPSGDILGRSGIALCLASDAVTNLGAFIAIIAISNKLPSDQLAAYSGMMKRAPLLSLAMALCLLSLTGIPPAAGFMAKFYLFNGAIQNHLTWLVIIAVINSVISAFYYLRVVKIMFMGAPASEEKVPSSGALRLALGLSCLGVLAIGILPAQMLNLAQAAIKILGS